MIFWLHIALLLIAASGLLLAGYLTAIFLRVQRGESVKCFDGACPIVMQTPDARLAGFPSFYLALPFYFMLLVFAVLRLFGHAEWLLWPVAVATLLSLSASAWLIYSLLVKLQRT